MWTLGGGLRNVRGGGVGGDYEGFGDSEGYGQGGNPEVRDSGDIWGGLERDCGGLTGI